MSARIVLFRARTFQVQQFIVDSGNDMAITERITWVTLGRLNAMLRYDSFKAHWTSLALPDCEFDDNVFLGPRSKLSAVKIGKGSYAMGAEICNATIGRYSSIGPRTFIGGYHSHPSAFVAQSPAFTDGRSPIGNPVGLFTPKAWPIESKGITIGSDVWIGADCRILDGCSIGNGAVIAAGAVVVRDVPSYMVVGGVPARIIKPRFSPEVVRSLERLQWWNWPDVVLGAAVRDGLFAQEVDELLLDRLQQLFCRGLGK